ncbi:MAG: GNAT family N-acetyltransferase [Planctomycetia bacterium]|nr:MAG: GNAT family N-acetyltransferase [Planctomycetia bacterium]
MPSEPQTFTAAIIRPMAGSDSADVARLHALTINRGFLARLGPRFLRELYIGIEEDPESAVWVAELDGSVCGFLAYTANVAGLYRRVLRARSWRLFLGMIPRVLRPAMLRNVLETLCYPRTQEAMHLPRAELLAVGIDPHRQGTGAGRRLVAAMLDRARADGVDRVKVVVGGDLDGANAFYPRVGFTRLTEFEHHGRMSIVYVIPVQSPP